MADGFGDGADAVELVASVGPAGVGLGEGAADAIERSTAEGTVQAALEVA